jgi:signal transduction histidine kinase
MSGIEDRHSSSDAPRMPEAAPKRFRDAAVQFLFGVGVVVLITFAALQLGVEQIPPQRSIGPGTISLLYLIVVVFVSIRAGFVASAAVSLIAAFCMSYFLLPLLQSLEARNPFDIVATVVFLTTAWVVSGMVTQVRKLTEAQLALQSQVSSRLMEVQETERRRLARELHDEVGQLVTGLLSLLRPNRDAPADALNARFEQARATVNDLLGRVRGLSFDLRPADLDDLGLLAALLALFERYTAQTGVVVSFKHQGMERRFAPELETGAYRIVQEALTNAARHACVTSVNVRVWADTEKLNLQIEDRGCGFDPDAVMKTPRSSGLIGMQERSRLLRGRLSIESAPGAGTTISAELPLGNTRAT